MSNTMGNTTIIKYSVWQRAAMGKYLTPAERTMLHIIRNSLAFALIVGIGALVTAMTHGATLQETLIAGASSFLTVLLGALLKYLQATGQQGAANATEQIEKDLPVIPPSPPTPPPAQG